MAIDNLPIPQGMVLPVWIWASSTGLMGLSMPKKTKNKKHEDRKKGGRVGRIRGS